MLAADRAFHEAEAVMWLPFLPHCPISICAALISYALHHSFVYGFLVWILTSGLVIIYNDFLYERLMDDYRSRLKGAQHLRKIEPRPPAQEAEDSS